MTKKEMRQRDTAIDIIEKVIEPLIKKGLNGEKYYKVEDSIIEIIKQHEKVR